MFNTFVCCCFSSPFKLSKLLLHRTSCDKTIKTRIQTEINEKYANFSYFIIFNILNGTYNKNIIRVILFLYRICMRPNHFILSWRKVLHRSWLTSIFIFMKYFLILTASFVKCIPLDKMKTQNLEDICVFFVNSILTVKRNCCIFKILT